MALGLSLALVFIPNHRREGFWLALTFLFMSWFVFKGRAFLFGGLYNHAARVSFSPSAVLGLYDWDGNQILTVFKYLLSISPLIGLVCVSRSWINRETKIKVFLFLGFFSPYLLGQTLSGSFARHYNTMLLAFVLALAIVLIRSEKVSKNVALLSCVFFFAFGISKYKKAIFLRQNHNFIPSCVRSNEAFDHIDNRIARLKADVEVIKKEAGDRAVTVIANGNILAPLLVAIPNVEAVHIGLIPAEHREVDWILVEYGDYGYLPDVPAELDWPNGFDRVVRESGGQVIEHRDGIFFARGPALAADIRKAAPTKFNPGGI